MGTGDVESAAAVFVAGDAAVGNEGFVVEDAFGEVGEAVLDKADVWNCHCSINGPSCVDIDPVIAVEGAGICVKGGGIEAFTKKGRCIEGSVAALTVSGKGKNIAIVEGDDAIGGQGDAAASFAAALDRGLNIAVAKQADIARANANFSSSKCIGLGRNVAIFQGEEIIDDNSKTANAACGVLTL
ncbi:MAG: hypothetical protein ACFB4J_02335 [Elainellaceae cyanobacterium]